LVEKRGAVAGASGAEGVACAGFGGARRGIDGAGGTGERRAELELTEERTEWRQASVLKALMYSDSARWMH
jgi:hypothetical protein